MHTASGCSYLLLKKLQLELKSKTPRNINRKPKLKASIAIIFSNKTGVDKLY